MALAGGSAPRGGLVRLPGGGRRPKVFGDTQRGDGSRRSGQEQGWRGVGEQVHAVTYPGVTSRP